MRESILLWVVFFFSVATLSPPQILSRTVFAAVASFRHRHFPLRRIIYTVIRVYRSRQHATIQYYQIIDDFILTDSHRDDLLGRQHESDIRGNDNLPSFFFFFSYRRRNDFRRYSSKARTRRGDSCVVRERRRNESIVVWAVLFIYLFFLLFLSPRDRRVVVREFLLGRYR